MLNSNEREALTSFMKYETRDLRKACRDAGVRPETVLRKIQTHKTVENKSRAAWLTNREANMLDGWLSSHGIALESWCKVYEITLPKLRRALRTMVEA